MNQVLTIGARAQDYLINRTKNLIQGFSMPLAGPFSAKDYAPAIPGWYAVTDNGLHRNNKDKLTGSQYRYWDGHVWRTHAVNGDVSRFGKHEKHEWYGLPERVGRYSGRQVHPSVRVLLNVETVFFKNARLADPTAASKPRTTH